MKNNKSKSLEVEKNDNGKMIKVGASIAGALGFTLIGYLLWDYFSKKNKSKKSKNDLLESGENLNNNNQVFSKKEGEEDQVDEETFMDARMDTLVQGETEFPKSAWDDGEFIPWMESRNKLFKR